MQKKSSPLFFTEIQRRGEAARQGMDGFKYKEGFFFANVYAIIEQEIARMALVRNEEREVLTFRISALKEKF